MLSSLYVAASMPTYVDTQIIDEDVQPINFDTDAPLIGISFMTYNAPRAYEIADQFRERGKTVIFGGYHPTFKPHEAIQHADSICIGEAENNLPNMIEDYISGKLKPFYKSELVDLKDLPILNRSLINNKAYFSTNAIQATRGCYHRCEFCSVSTFNQHKIRTRPIDHVIDELKGLGRTVIFMDDNIALEREYAKELFTKMIPLKKRWQSQCEISIAEDDELLDLAKRSGCQGFFTGFESLSQQSLSNWNKHFNKKKDYLKLIKKLHEKGFAIAAGFVFGSDTDTADIFSSTLKFLIKANIEVLQASRLTPFPGTQLYDKLKEDGRIFDNNWTHYDFSHVVYNPLKMSSHTLDSGTAWLQQQFYSYKSIIRRTIKASRYLSIKTILQAVLPLNLGYRFRLLTYGMFELGKSFNPKINQ